MNDAERDAWLREALRHAPDSDALPPSGVSEAILPRHVPPRAPRRRGAIAPRARARESVAGALGLAGAAAGRRRIRQRHGSDARRPDVVGPADGRGHRARAGDGERSRRVDADRLDAGEIRRGLRRRNPSLRSPDRPRQARWRAAKRADAHRPPTHPGALSTPRRSPGAAAIPPTRKNDERAVEGRAAGEATSDAPAPFPASEQQRETEKATVTVRRGAKLRKKEVDLDGLRADAMTQPSAPPRPRRPCFGKRRRHSRRRLRRRSRRRLSAPRRPHRQRGCRAAASPPLRRRRRPSKAAASPRKPATPARPAAPTRLWRRARQRRPARRRPPVTRRRRRRATRTTPSRMR